MQQPTEEEIERYTSDYERHSVGAPPVGPLTRGQQASLDAYEAYIAAETAEYDAMMAAGRRTICPKCDNRSVKHGTCVTLGYAGHPGAEYSGYEECERCDYKDLA